jgi:hypothetical protein
MHDHKHKHKHTTAWLKPTTYNVDLLSSPAPSITLLPTGSILAAQILHVYSPLHHTMVCLLTHHLPAQNGQVYIVENNQLLRPLVKTAALSCINPNVWFDHRTWSPGTLTNYASSKRLFKESHQPNRRSV